MMYRIAERVASGKCNALVTGDNIGQVASQTLDNMVVITKAVKIPILRPLLCFDKTETTKLAEEIETFQFSKFHKCCGMTPMKPRTKARLYEVLNAEKSLDIKKMVRNAIKNKKTMRL
ncbi:MAG: tRNA 4-thiouridine(8) synthase ThiI, partial [Candidatus Aenigmarchaeota archaeon]|nr:tRNA 4-thiouridine(8) synthase ThiI [Candidatus Aenigmarchaeota archaeon]